MKKLLIFVVIILLGSCGEAPTVEKVQPALPVDTFQIDTIGMTGADSIIIGENVQ